MNLISIHIAGGLVSPDFLETIHDATGQKPTDFGLERRASLVDEVSAIWGDARAYWEAFQRRVARVEQGRSGESLTTMTREQWIIPLLEALGYTLSYQRRASEVDGRSYAISHRAVQGDDDDIENYPPVHIMPIDQKLGDRPPTGRGTLAPHALLQDYLNRSDDHLWGIVTNGRILRLLRDSTYFTRPSYIEFDLEQMIAGERLDEFFLLYRLVQRTRLPQPDQDPGDCLLEQYYQATLEQGGRIRNGLRQAVTDAIIHFGNGFLRHPRNDELRQKLADGSLTPDAYYQQLLHLIYRLLFLLVAESRNLLAVDPSSAASAEKSHFYRDYFSISRLRQLADTPLSAPERFDDLYLGLRTLFHAFHDEKLAAQLGVPPLNGQLFSGDETPDLGVALLTNRDLLHAVRLLSWFTPQDERVQRRVNYAALDVEELGSVYESLLDEQPVIDQTTQPPTFGFVSGTTRKTTGSYYTPRELVNEVIKSALDPVIADRLAAAETQQAQEAALLALTVCDPACGSGHFLLAAARRIGYALARVRTGADEPAPEQIRAATRDAITHCIYGVDRNPLAVDLCKVALWIEGHSGGKPLTFLDYRIRCGDSLVGVFDLGVLDDGIPDDAYKPVTDDDKKTATALRKQNKTERETGQMSLLHVGQAQRGYAVADWQQLADLPEDTPAQVNQKQTVYDQLRAQMAADRTACDLWTAAFFCHLTAANERAGRIPTTDTLRRYRRNPQGVKGDTIGTATALAAELRFFHWPLEFPQVFEAGGFGVVLGNPPWERIKLQEKEYFKTRVPAIASARNKAARTKLIAKLKTDQPAQYRAFQNALHNADALSKFLRGSDRFPLTARGDINTYTVFTELSRRATAPLGRAGIIVPTGIATDKTTSDFFSDLVQSQSLAQLLGFENEAKIFPEVHNAFKFCVLSMTGAQLKIEEADFIFLCRYFEQLRHDDRHFTLSRDDFAAINPNTLSCPIFRTKADAELTKKIYRRVPVLINEATGSNPWGVSFMRMFDMSNDSNLFANEPRAGYVPLYEAKMIWHFDHRFSTYENATQAEMNAGRLPQLDEADHQDPFKQVQPRYWVAEREVEERLHTWSPQWLLNFRDITGPALERTTIVTFIPRFGVGHTSPSVFPGITNVLQSVALVSNLNALTLDYITRQKMGGVHLTYFILNQLPLLTPEQYETADLQYISQRATELVYTSWDMQPFADDIWREADDELRQAIRRQWALNQTATGGHTPSPAHPITPTGFPRPPFNWDDERRAHLRADLDAYYARLYGLTRDELRYILDPADVYGPDFPGETFRVLKEKEIKQHGEYRTQRLVLAAWDRQEQQIARGELDFSNQGSAISNQPSAPVAVNTPRKPTAKPQQAKAKPQPPMLGAKPAPKRQPRQAPLADLTIATSGSFGEQLKRMGELAKRPDKASPVELVAFLQNKQNAIRWMATTALQTRGGEDTVAALAAFLRDHPDHPSRKDAVNVLQHIANNPHETDSTKDLASRLI
ncbi:MAG: N-6 DNA methylase [Anaerolineae bacterium]|nr:N-6 DNA methylase [Anaerolineae bacterium]